MPIYINSLELQGPSWDDMRAPATRIFVPGQPTDPDFDSTNVGWLFDPAASEAVYIVFQLPHSYMEGSSLNPHIHWQPVDANSGTVKWQMEYKWVNDFDSDAVSFTAISVTDNTAEEAFKLQKSYLPNIAKADAKISSILTVKLSRIGADDSYASDALLKEFDIHFQSNTSGSISNESKF